jgi:hypothetical protein
MQVRMAGLTRTSTGRYVGRKVLPPDVREAYARAYGPKFEAKFSLPSTTREQDAKLAFTNWLSEVEARSKAIRGGKPIARVTKAGAGPWQLFEAWATAVQAAPSTISRWRSIFQSLENLFGDRTISEDDARQWARGLVSDKRTAVTVKVWINAARTVYTHAVDQQLAASNPFKVVKVTVPRKMITRESKAFTTDEIDWILSNAAIIEPVSTFGYAKRFVPWILAYSGARGSHNRRGVQIYQRQ